MLTPPSSSFLSPHFVFFEMDRTTCTIHDELEFYKSLADNLAAALHEAQKTIETLTPTEICAECGEMVGADANYCHSCGEGFYVRVKFDYTCPDCSNTMSADAKFCDSCGSGPLYN